MAPILSKLKEGESSYAQLNSKYYHTLSPYLCSGCRRPHEIHMLNDDEDFGPKFGQVPLEESMLSNDNDSMESDPSEDSCNSRPSTFDPRITTTTATIPATVADHQLPPHATSCTITSGALPSTLCDPPTIVAAFVCSSPPSNYFAPDLVHLEAKIFKQGRDITDRSTRFAKLHAKLIPFCNLLSKEG